MKAQQYLRELADAWFGLPITTRTQYAKDLDLYVREFPDVELAKVLTRAKDTGKLEELWDMVFDGEKPNPFAGEISFEGVLKLEEKMRKDTAVDEVEYDSPLTEEEYISHLKMVDQISEWFEEILPKENPIDTMYRMMSEGARVRFQKALEDEAARLGAIEMKFPLGKDLSSLERVGRHTRGCKFKELISPMLDHAKEQGAWWLDVDDTGIEAAGVKFEFDFCPSCGCRVDEG